MMYVTLGAMYLDVGRFEALPSHGQTSRIVYAGRSRPMMYANGRLRQEEWGTVKEHMEDEMDMSVLHNEAEVV